MKIIVQISCLLKSNWVVADNGIYHGIVFNNSALEKLDNFLNETTSFWQNSTDAKTSINISLKLTSLIFLNNETN
ncbi:hypothetical protein BpHYR1_041964 [Brachionus plicatilis]|uniref:Uncharacterized protein n=1 Tax=Brachionus plicatilis TaxID=10195 RepID=A0A3M7QDB1_BRAPC|nr:hypothetical protein BpHYR1_041964 [Brachionus plicatilis]